MTTTPPALPGLVTPQDPAYDEARLAWNLSADLRPAAIATATTAEQAAAAVRHAREQGLRVVPQASGHLAAALPDLSGALLLRTRIEPKVVVDPERRTALIGAGALWADVVEAIAPHGLAALSGSTHDVGVVGYITGGGLSWLGRQYGLAANHVRRFEVVTADGELRTASADSEPDLFWALRGGSGNFAVVTHLEIDLFEIAELHAGIAIWDGEHAAEILRRWRDWTRTAPESVTTSARILQLPPLPEIPEPLRARPLVAVDGAALGGEAEAIELLGPLREVAEPIMDTWATIPPAGLMAIHMDPPGPVPGIGDHAMLADLPDEALSALLEVAGPDTGSPLLAAELRHTGGALTRNAGIPARLDGEYLLFGVGVPMDPALAEAIPQRLDALVGALEPWATGSVYLNFDERPGNGERAFDADAYARLREIRAAYDPDGILLAGHEIPTA